MWGTILLIGALVLSSFGCKNSSARHSVSMQPVTYPQKVFDGDKEMGEIRLIGEEGYYMVDKFGPVKTKEGDQIFVPKGSSLKQVKKK